MYSTRIAAYREAAAQQARPSSEPSSPALPQPLMRLTAMASIGIGAGLFSASAPTEILVLTFAPAVVAMVVIAVKSVVDMPETGLVDEIHNEVSHG